MWRTAAACSRIPPRRYRRSAAFDLAGPTAQASGTLGPQGEGAVLASNAVETQGKGTIVSTRAMEGSGNEGNGNAR